MSVVTAVPGVAAPQRTSPVSGDLLQTALLPDSAFGASYSSYSSGNSGARPRPARGTGHLPRISCAAYEDYVFTWGFGNTAGAYDQFENPEMFKDQPTIFWGSQQVLHFASAQAATSYYHQALAKYRACRDFTEPFPADHRLGGGKLDVSATSVIKTRIGRYYAFQVTQDFAPSEASGVTGFVNTLVAIAGADVYSFWDQSGTNDEPWPALMAKLIRNVQRLR